MKAFKSAGVFALCLIFLLFAGAWGKVRIDSRACYLSGERLLSTAPPRFQEALSLYLESVRCYTPGSGYNRKALHRAMEAGKRFEERGMPIEALQVYCRLRQTLLSIGLFHQPFPDVLRETDLRIRRLAEQ